MRQLPARLEWQLRGVKRGLFQLGFELFHEVFEIALRFTAVSKWTYFITFADSEVPKVLLGKYSFAAIRGKRMGIVLVSIVRHRERCFSSNYFE